MKIFIRNKIGWVERENKSDVVCDHCKQKLWSAPNKRLYCNHCKIDDNKIVITNIDKINLKEFEGEQYIKIRTLNNVIKHYIDEGKDLSDLQSRIVTELIK